MGLVRLEPPAAPVVSLEEARAHLRVDAVGEPPVYPEDALIMSYFQAATDELDGPDGWFRRALVTQQLRLSFDCFPCHRIKLPLPPLISVDEIAYVAPDGASVIIDPADIRVVIEADPGYVEPAFGKSWPAARAIGGAVAITYKAGYGAPDKVPEIIKHYIKLRAGQFFEHREMVIAGTIITPLPYARDNLESIRGPKVSF